MSDFPNRQWISGVSPSVHVPRTPLLRSEIPEEYEGEFYAEWVSECGGEFWTPWIMWDIDNADVNESLRMARQFIDKLLQCTKPEAIRVVFSTNKGFHIYLDSRTVDLQPSKFLHSQLKNFALRLLPGTDASFYSQKRIVGIPNSIHRTTGLYYVSIPLENLNEWNIEQMRHFARSPREFEERADFIPKSEILCEEFRKANEFKPGRMLSSLEIQERNARPHPAWYGVKDGDGRDKLMFEAVRHYKLCGLSIQEVYALVSDLNSRNIPPHKDSFVRQKVNHAFKNENIQI